MEITYSFSEIIKCESGALLSAVKQSDAAEFFKIILENQIHFSKFEFIAPNFKSVADVEKIIAKLNEFKDSKKGVNYGLWIDGSLSGLFTVNSTNWETQTADVGYWLIESAIGKGQAFSGLCALCNSLRTMGFKVLTASTAVSNIRSQNLLTKVGFRKEKILEQNITVGSKAVDEILFISSLSS